MTIDIPDSLGRLMYDDNVTDFTKILLDIFAAKAHSHSQSDITGLESTLAGFLKESDLDNVLKINLDSWEYTTVEEGSSVLFKNSVYTFNQIEKYHLRIFTAASIRLIGREYGYSDSLKLPDGGTYLYGGSYGYSEITRNDYAIPSGIRPGGEKFFSASSDNDAYIGSVFAIRLS